MVVFVLYLFTVFIVGIFNFVSKIILLFIIVLYCNYFYTTRPASIELSILPCLDKGYDDDDDPLDDVKIFDYGVSSIINVNQVKRNNSKKGYYKLRSNYYKMRQLSLLQSIMGSY